MKLGILATHPIQYHAPLFRELARREGVDLTVYFCHRPTPAEQGSGFGVAFEWDVDLTAGYRHHFLKNKARRPTRGFFGYDTPEISEIIRRERFDLFIVHGWACKSSWQAFRACWEYGTRLGVRSDSQLPQGRVGFKGLLKMVVKQLAYPLFIRKLDVCLPYGQRSAEYFERFGAKNIVIAPHFVDNNWFARKAAEFRVQRDELRRQWQIPADAFCFLFCGKLQSKKRPMDLLKAFALLFTQIQNLKSKIDHHGSPIHLLIVGDGKLRGQCEELAQSHHLPVTFAGFLNQGEMPKAYAAADCLALPSDDGETWGLVVNEAMACGLPVIVSDACGCVPDLIREGKTGYSYRCGEVDELCKKMILLADSQYLVNKNNLTFEAILDNCSQVKSADIILKA